MAHENHKVHHEHLQISGRRLPLTLGVNFLLIAIGYRDCKRFYDKSRSKTDIGK